MHHRHPAFNPAGTHIAYDSDAFGLSIDLWTVNVSLDDVANDGQAGENDDVKSSVEKVFGGSAADVLTGSAADRVRLAGAFGGHSADVVHLQ